MAFFKLRLITWPRRGGEAGVYPTVQFGSRVTKNLRVPWSGTPYFRRLGPEPGAPEGADFNVSRQ